MRLVALFASLACSLALVASQRTCTTSYDCDCPYLRADFVFIVDATASMKPKIDNVKSGLAFFAQSLDSYDIDSEYAIVLVGGESELLLDFTSDVNEVSTWFEKISVRNQTSRVSEQLQHYLAPEPLLETIQSILGQRSDVQTDKLANVVRLYGDQVRNGRTWTKGGRSGRGVAEQWQQPSSGVGYYCGTIVEYRERTVRMCDSPSASPCANERNFTHGWPMWVEDATTSAPWLRVLDEVSGERGYVLPDDTGYAVFEPCPFVDKLAFRDNATPYIIVVTDENSDVPFQRPNRVRKYGNSVSSMEETAIRDSIDGTTTSLLYDAPLKEFSTSECSEQWIANLASINPRKPWISDLLARAQDFDSSGAWLTMFLNSSHPIVREQLGSSNEQAEDKTDYSDYDRAQTLANLEAAGLACNLQAQVLRQSSSSEVRVYDIESIGNGGVVESFFGAVVEGIGRKRCPTAKRKRAGGCICDACDAFECVNNLCARVDQCAKAECVKQCNIGDKCYFTRALNPADGCEQCRPELSKTQFSPNPCIEPGEEACKTNVQCVNQECSFTIADGKCATGGKCYNNGDASDDDKCLKCFPEIAQDKLTFDTVVDQDCIDRFEAGDTGGLNGENDVNVFVPTGGASPGASRRDGDGGGGDSCIAAISDALGQDVPCWLLAAIAAALVLCCSLCAACVTVVLMKRSKKNKAAASGTGSGLRRRGSTNFERRPSSGNLGGGARSRGRTRGYSIGGDGAGGRGRSESRAHRRQLRSTSSVAQLSNPLSDPLSAPPPTLKPPSSAYTANARTGNRAWANTATNQAAQRPLPAPSATSDPLSTWTQL